MRRAGPSRSRSITAAAAIAIGKDQYFSAEPLQVHFPEKWMPDPNTIIIYRFLEITIAPTDGKRSRFRCKGPTTRRINLENENCGRQQIVLDATVIHSIL